jgi:hypothetical protein
LAGINNFLGLIALGPVTDRLPDLYAEIRQALQTIDMDLDDYPLLEPRQADEADGVLFDSSRDYADQLTHTRPTATAKMHHCVNSLTRSLADSPLVTWCSPPATPATLQEKPGLFHLYTMRITS